MNPVLALIIANIIWGAAAPIFKFSLTNIPPFTLAFLRFFFAALIFMPFAFKFNYRQLSKGDWLRVFLAALFGMTINISFFFMGLERTESINAPIIASSGPLILFLFSVIFLKEKIVYKSLVGMFISLLGVLTIILSPILFDGKTVNMGSALIGNIMFFIATVSAVLDPLIAKKILLKYGPYPIIPVAFFISSLTFAPFMMFELQEWSLMSLNIAGITGIVFGVLFSSALAYLLYYYGISKIKVQEVGIFTYIDPVVAVLIAIPLLGEYPSLYFFIGSILVFGGIYISEGRIHYHPFHILHLYKREKSFQTTV